MTETESAWEAAGASVRIQNIMANEGLTPEQAALEPNSRFRNTPHFGPLSLFEMRQLVGGDMTNVTKPKKRGTGLTAEEIKWCHQNVDLIRDLRQIKPSVE